MAEVSAGLLLFRRREGCLEVLVVHPGGPLWAKKDEGAWSIPKGLLSAGEDPAACARREFEEEIGQPAPRTPYLSLGEVKLKSGKRVIGFGAEGDADPERLASNTFSMEWPPRSGRRASFPEVDRALWLSPDLAKVKLNPAQAPLVDRLVAAVASGAAPLGGPGSDDPPRHGDR